MTLIETLLLPLERLAIFVGARWASLRPWREAVAGQWHRTVAAPMEWVTLYAAILIGLGMIVIDEPLAVWLKEVITGDFEGFLKIVTNLGLAGVWLIPSGLLSLMSLLARRVALTPVAARHYGRLAWSSGFVFLSIALSGLIGNLIKLLIGRSRPRLLFEDGIAAFTPFSHGWAVNSFPSGHSQAITSAMVALTILYPRHAVSFLSIAAVVSASRCLTTVHYFSDVVAGMWLGMFVTLALARVLAMKGIDIGPSRRSSW